MRRSILIVLLVAWAQIARADATASLGGYGSSPPAPREVIGWFLVVSGVFGGVAGSALVAQAQPTADDQRAAGWAAVGVSAGAALAGLTLLNLPACHRQLALAPTGNGLAIRF
jgi:hypothetical protein